VCPDNYNSLEGSWYTNSAVTGNWEDFVVQEVVSYIDSHYRTLAVPESRDGLIAATQVTTYSIWLDTYVRTLLSRAAAFAPNPALGPVKGELPLDENGTLIDSTWQKWLEHDLYSMLDEYSDNLKDLEGIRFDCGNDDISHIAGVNFSNGLTSHGVDHLFESYPGTHTDRIAERMAT
jgi:S-formylglutathione hydrolase